MAYPYVSFLYGAVEDVLERLSVREMLLVDSSCCRYYWQACSLIHGKSSGNSQFTPANLHQNRIVPTWIVWQLAEPHTRARRRCLQIGSNPLPLSAFCYETPNPPINRSEIVIKMWFAKWNSTVVARVPHTRVLLSCSILQESIWYQIPSARGYG
jgi:hypothetical protein